MTAPAMYFANPLQTQSSEQTVHRAHLLHGCLDLLCEHQVLCP
jgi:hypothetical protein